MLPRGEHLLEIVTERTSTRAVRVAGYMTSSMLLHPRDSVRRSSFSASTPIRGSADGDIRENWRPKSCSFFRWSSIWLMLLYQFVLTIGGFLWRQRLAPAETPGRPSGRMAGCLDPDPRPERRESHRRPAGSSPRPGLSAGPAGDHRDQRRKLGRDGRSRPPRPEDGPPRVRLDNIPPEEGGGARAPS